MYHGSNSQAGETNSDHKHKFWYNFKENWLQLLLKPILYRLEFTDGWFNGYAVSIVIKPKRSYLG